MAEPANQPAQATGGGWLILIAAPLAGLAAGYLGARLALHPYDAALATRPPVLVQNLAALLRDAEPDQAAAVIAESQRTARRLAEGGVLVLDANAVLAAPADMYLEPSR